VELHIDFSITSKYGDCQDFYSQNLKIFMRSVRVFENLFKKEKYQNSEIKMDEDAKEKATIKFCGKKYGIGLVVDPADLNSASIVLAKINGDALAEIGEIAIDHSGNITFPDNKKVSLNDDYEFTNAILNFFIDAATKNKEAKTTSL
jgi:hypothetical protein